MIRKRKNTIDAENVNEYVKVYIYKMKKIYGWTLKLVIKYEKKQQN